MVKVVDGAWHADIGENIAGIGRATVSSVDVARWIEQLADVAPAGDDAGRIDQIKLLETLKAASAAAQARITEKFAASQRRLHRASPGDPRTAADSAELRRDLGNIGSAGALAASKRRAHALRLANRSAAGQVALARCESPAMGGRFIGLAEALVHEMPHTLRALATGEINEWRATVIVRETASLSAAQRGAVDAEIAGRVAGLGNGRIQAMVRKMAYRLEPEATTRRCEKSAVDRRVSIRPAPDCMAYVTALLPLPVLGAWRR